MILLNNRESQIRYNFYHKTDIAHTPAYLQTITLLPHLRQSISPFSPLKNLKKIPNFIKNMKKQLTIYSLTTQ